MKLEGDDRITWEMYNRVAALEGKPCLTEEEWAFRSDMRGFDRSRYTVALKVAREHLVAPAVAEAKKRGMELSQETINVLQAERDKLRAWADEWNSKACALQHQLNLANDSLAAEKSRSENLAKGLREANRLGTDYVGEIRELRAKVAELEAKLAIMTGPRDEVKASPWGNTTQPAALPKVGETVEVLLDSGGTWAKRTVTAHWKSRVAFILSDGESRALLNEGKTWRRVQPQTSESAPEADPVEPTYAPKPSEPAPEDPRQPPECPGPDCPMCNGSGCNKCGAGFMPREVGHVCEHDVMDRHEGSAHLSSAKIVKGQLVSPEASAEHLAGQVARRPAPTTMKDTAPSEPPPEDVATPELDAVKGYEPDWELDEMLPELDGKWIMYHEAKAAVAIDLSAAIARETERPRAENELLREEATSWRVMWSDKHDEYAQLRDEFTKLVKERDDLRAQLSRAEQCRGSYKAIVDTIAKEITPEGKETLCMATVRTIRDLRRQLREHAGECAVCGVALQDRSSFPWKGVRVCGDCAQQSQSKLEAAIDARRAGK